MKLKRIILMTILALLPVISGCADSIGGDTSGVFNSSLTKYSDDSSTAPFDMVSAPISPESPKLQYLGTRDITSSDAYELYIKTYAPDLDGDVIEWERVSSGKLASRLTERISADLSPDLCDKLDNSLTLLTKKNLYEDLTEYIDITAPQWVPYAEYITSSGTGKGRYFYPTEIIVSPYLLLYRKNAFLSDPLSLWRDGEWTISALRRTSGSNSVIGGSAVAENLLASGGKMLFSVDKNGRVTSNLHSESFFQSAALIAELASYSVENRSENEVEQLRNGNISFLSITEERLAEIRCDYPEEEFEIVPYPRGDNADEYYYYALAEGYLVPKRAKNIKGAASFINCSRIAAQSDSAPDYLLESDIITLSEVRSAELSQAVFDTNYCLDDAANSAAADIIAEIFTNGADNQALDEFIKKIEAPVIRAISEINQS